MLKKFKFKRKIFTVLTSMLIIFSMTVSSFAMTIKASYDSVLRNENIGGDNVQGYFSTSLGTPAFCGMHTYKAPFGNNYAEDVGKSLDFTATPVKDEYIRKALYYGYRGPKEWSGFNNYNKNYGILAGANLGYRDLYGQSIVGLTVSNHDGIGDYASFAGVEEFDRYIRSMPNAPAGFKAYRLDNDYTKQGKQYLYTFAPYRPEGRAKLKKVTASNKHLTDICPEHYSLEGARYVVKNSSGRAVATLTTDSDGDSNTVSLDEGNYTLQEISAPKGYKLDKKTYRFSVSSDRTTTVSVADEPLFDPLTLKIQKSAETTAPKKLSLEGAIYTVKYYKDYLTESQVDSATPFRIWEFSTNKQGLFEIKEKYKVGGDDLFKSENGKVVGLFGTYVFQEKQAPKGFALSKERIVKYVKPDSDNTGIIAMNDAEFVEQSQKMNIELQKVDSETNEAKAQGIGSLKGATYDVLHQDEDTNEDTKVGEIVTDENGYGIIKNLEIGIYKIKETIASAGYVLDNIIHKITGNYEELNTPVFTYKTTSKEKPTTTKAVKTSIDEKDNKVYVEGAKLQLSDSKGKVIDTWTSTGGGKVFKALPKGDYVIKELEAPEGYLIMDSEHNFKVKETEEEQLTEVFNEPIPQLTSISLFKSITKHSLPIENASLNDEVSYKKVLKGHSYTYRGKIVDKTDLTKVYATAEKTFTPDSASGKVDVEFNINTKELYGKDLVAIGELYRDDRKTENKKVASHINLDDLLQTTSIPTVKTKLTTEFTEDKKALPLSHVSKTDEIKFTNLFVGEKYEYEGQIVDPKTKKVLSESSIDFVAKDKEETHKIDFNLSTKDYRGKELVAIGKLYQLDKNGKRLDVSAEHIDVQDKEQTVDIVNPKVSSKLTTEFTEDKKALPLSHVSKTDTIVFSDILKDVKYQYEGQIIDPKTKKVLSESSINFVAKENEETHKVDFNLSTKDYRGQDLVAVGKLYALNDKGEKLDLLAEHNDIKDKEQTVHIVDPKVKSKLTTEFIEDKKALPLSHVSKTDTIVFSDILKDVKYQYEGQIVDPKTKKVLSESSINFVAKENEETHKVDFNLSTKDFRGQDLVAIGKLYALNDKGEKLDLLAEHNDLTDKEQTVHIVDPKVKSKLTTEFTESKKALPLSHVSKTDTIVFSDILKDVKYQYEGQIVDPKTNKVLSESSINFVAKENEEIHKVDFNLSTKEYRGQDLVAVGKLYALNDKGEKLDLLAEHNDLQDKEQTVHIVDPKVKSKLTTEFTEDKKALPLSHVSKTDTIVFSDILKDVKYQYEGQIVDPKTNKVLSESSINFVAKENEETHKVDFNLSTKDFRGQDLVAVGKLYALNDKGEKLDLLAEHKDLTDKEQTVHVVNPKVTTKLTTMFKEDKKGLPLSKVKKIDTVNVSDILKGVKYIYEAKLVDKMTGKEIANNKITFTANSNNEQHKVEFNFNAKDLRGRELVAVGKLYAVDKAKRAEEIASHNDLQNKEQTVYIENPEIKTTANFDNGSKIKTVGNNLVIVDKVEYKNLIVGEKYTLKAKLMDKTTGKPYIANGKEVTGTKTFIPKSKSGSEEVELTFDVSKVDKNTDVVVFEKLLYAEEEIASHEEIKDKGQTVTLAKVGYINVKDNNKLRERGMRTGDVTNVLGIAFVISLAIIGLFIFRRRKNK